VALTDADLRHYRQRLTEERARLMRALGRFTAAQADESEQDRAGDLTSMPFHPADLGTDTIDTEVDASIASRESAELAEIDAALDRLDRAPERFGIDENTGKPIPRERLELIPWARTVVAPERGDRK
jgi:RNA polymerase-binding transcription factor DksA